MNPSSLLCLAADVPLPRAEELASELSQVVGTIKVGSSLFTEHGPKAVERLQRHGHRIFLDLKLHDIPNTMALAARNITALGVAYFTVHASAGSSALRAVQAAVEEEASRRSLVPPTVLAVTVLTSLSELELEELGVPGPANAQVQRLTALTKSSGLRGLVCSPREAAAARAALGPNATVCTPGIRNSASNNDDQTRVETATFALAHGANLLVIGRPITEAADPQEAAQRFLAEVSRFASKGGTP